ncbi:uncharacterized protein LOC114531113 [Dendronephthya gigantea]|uniref:uncharacterized protein LOC114531113 n=1 Tax=Dendronephthya gigantea TaxID=151771 RepID=UPI00106D8180|nr:uncharacterized protein LOC114531113 [Dendronephthya gigantea]
MAKSETNAHLHKVLTHRNYMHHVTLQKELKSYEKQKKVVEKELSQIIKVRRAIQQINGTLLKESRKGKKENSSKKAWEQKMTEDGITFGKKEEHEDEEVHKYDHQEKSLIKKSNVSSQGVSSKIQHHLSEYSQKPEFHTRQESRTYTIHSDSYSEHVHDHDENDSQKMGSMEKSNALDKNDDSQNLKDREIRTQSTPNSKNTKLFTRRPPYVKSCSLPNFSVQKLDEIRESATQENQQCQMYRPSKTPTRMISRDRNASPNEDLYKKSLLTNFECVRGAKEGKEQCEIHHSPKTQTGMASEDYSSDGILFTRTTSDHHHGITKLPTLANLQGSVCVPVDDARKTIDDSNYGNNGITSWTNNRVRNSSAVFRAFPNNDVCLVPRARNRSQTVCDLEEVKSRRARARTISCMDNPEYGRSTRVAVPSTAETEYSRHRAFSYIESVGLKEDETIAIKGKFRQIGHTVLAVALMKKMASKK